MGLLKTPGHKGYALTHESSDNWMLDVALDDSCLPQVCISSSRIGNHLVSIWQWAGKRDRTTFSLLCSLLLLLSGQLSGIFSYLSLLLCLLSCSFVAMATASSSPLFYFCGFCDHGQYHWSVAVFPWLLWCPPQVSVSSIPSEISTSLIINLYNNGWRWLWGKQWKCVCVFNIENKD